MAKRLGLACCLLGLLAPRLYAQDLPEDELQVNFSGYFDSFNVTVIYPNISLTRRVDPATSLTGHYLVDVISAASIKTDAETAGAGEGDDIRGRRVDAVTAASGRGGFGTAYPRPDDVRHEVSLGATRLIPRGTLALNGIYSGEHDYTSATVAGTLTQAFARKNTTLRVGFVHSWDKVFPVTKDWRRDKRVTSLSADVSQLLGQRLIAQVLFSYTNESGQLADVYQYVTIDGQEYDPVHPGSRIRRAAAARLSYRLDRQSSLQLGYRYYWDTWDVTSHTLHGLYQRHVSPAVTIGLGLRSYFQSRASFFKPAYTAPEAYMTVDNKLNAGYSNEVQFNLSLNGGTGEDYLPFLSDENVQYNFSINVYRRHTRTADWFSGKTNLYAAYFNAGIRYRF